MPVTELEKASLASKDESLQPEARISAVREWLRLSYFSARSRITAKHLAKSLLKNEFATPEQKQKAERLLSFVANGEQKKKAPALTELEELESALLALRAKTITPSAPGGPKLYYIQYETGDPNPSKEKIAEYRERILASIDPNRPMSLEYTKELREQFIKLIYEGAENANNL